MAYLSEFASGTDVVVDDTTATIYNNTNAWAEVNLNWNVTTATILPLKLNLNGVVLASNRYIISGRSSGYENFFVNFNPAISSNANGIYMRGNPPYIGTCNMRKTHLALGLLLTRFYMSPGSITFSDFDTLSNDVIKFITVEFKYPQVDKALVNTVDEVRVDKGEVTVGNITWVDEDGVTVTTPQAEEGARYTATFTVTASSSAKFAQAIGQGHITVINTAETTEVYIESIEATQPIVGGNILIVKVTFSPVGQTNPYDEEELESDPLEEPPNPTITAVDTSFFTAYAPSKSELNALASYMWNNTDNWLDTFNRMFANPMECILGLSIVPVSVSGSPKNVVFGNVETSISMPAISSQYVSVNCGSVRLSEQWRTYLDYNPYTKVRLYLPYCGVHELDTDEVMGRDIAVSYKVDVLNGNVIAYVKDGSQVKWVFSGNCAMQVPVTAQQFVNSSLGYAAAAGNQVTNFVKGLGIQPTMDRNEALQKPGGILNWAPFSPFASFPALGSAVSAVQGSKSNVIHQGNFSGGVGQLSIQTPFLVIERPRPVMANVYQQFEGFPNFASLPLSSCKGFTRVESIHLSGMTCTAEEQAMIEQALKGGVII